MYSKNRIVFLKNKLFIFTIFSLQTTMLMAFPVKQGSESVKGELQHIFSTQPESSTQYIKLSGLQDFQTDHWLKRESFDTAPLVHRHTSWETSEGFDFNQAIQYAVRTHPDIQQQVASLAAQNENIDVAKAAYLPQLSGGISTGDFTSRERGQQLISLNATQMLYDFGKTQSNVDIQKSRLLSTQTQLLITVDDIAFRVASTITNIQRTQEMLRIAKQQIQGIQRIVEITQLRAQAGLSSQADPVQAKSYLESAQAHQLEQESRLKQYQFQLNSLIGTNVKAQHWQIPDLLIRQSELYREPNLNHIPRIMQAHAEIQVAQAQKLQTQKNRYPTVNIKGTISQAVNGRHPNTNEDNGRYSSIMLEANSQFFQGGAIAAQARSASYAEQTARAKLQSVYLEIMDQIRISREQVENKEKQMKILQTKQATTMRTKALYQEQYKLGTRSALDLLNAEQAIHATASDIENTRYDIYNSLIQYISASGRSREVYGLDQLNLQGVVIQP